MACHNNLNTAILSKIVDRWALIFARLGISSGSAAPGCPDGQGRRLLADRSDELPLTCIPGDSIVDVRYNPLNIDVDTVQIRKGQQGDDGLILEEG